MRLVVALLLFSFSSAAIADARAHLSLIGRSFFTKPSEPVDQYEGLLQGEYDNTFHITQETLSFKFHPFFQVSSLPQSWGAPYIAEPREVYLSAESKSFYFRTGYFTIVYEGTDGINPMDIASFKYWGDPLNSINRASAGVHVGYTGNNFEFEATYFPQVSPSVLPGETSPWLPRHSRFPLRNESLEVRLPDRVDYVFSDREVLNEAFRHNLTSRIQLRTDFGDASVAYFEGAADFPLITPTLNLTPIFIGPDYTIYELQSPATILPRYYRRRTVAGLITKPFGEWIVRLATRYDQPLMDAKQYTTWSGESVGGVERTFSLWNQPVTFLLQGSLEHYPRSNSLISIHDLFDKAIILGVRWPVSDYWTFQFSGLRSGKDQSALYLAQVTRTFASQWSAKLAVELVEGPPQSVLGIFDKNDRVGLELTRSF